MIRQRSKEKQATTILSIALATFPFVLADCDNKKGSVIMHCTAVKLSLQHFTFGIKPRLRRNELHWLIPDPFVSRPLGAFLDRASTVQAVFI